MACAYRTGATARELAITYDLSLSSVKRLLRTAGIRRAPSKRGFREGQADRHVYVARSCSGVQPALSGITVR
jgi:hypothetical protein